MSDKNKNNSNNNNLQQRFKNMPLQDAIASTGMLYGIKDNNTGKIVVVNPDGKITITSHHRPNAVTKSGRPSNHSIKDNAWDIVPANGWSWNNLYNFLNTDETMGNWFKYRRDARGRQYKVLEEISQEQQRRYDATGPNLHIGGDGTVNVGLYTEGRDSKANLSRRAMTKDERNFWQAYDRNWGGTSLDTPEWRNFWGNLVRKESGFNASARNSEDAYGYFQLMPFNRTKSSKYTIDDQFRDAKKVLEQNFASFNKNLTSKDAATIAQNHWDKYALMRGAWLGGVGNVIKYVRRLANAKDSNGTSVGNYIQGDWANVDYSGTNNLYTDDSSDYSLYAVDNPSNDYSTNYQEPELPQNQIYEIPDLEAPDNQLANNDEEQEQLLQNLSLLQQQAELAEYTKQLQQEQEQQQRLQQNINYADNISYSPKQQEISPLEQYVQELMSQPSSEAQQILSSLWSQPREDFAFANNPLLQDKEDLALAYQTAQNNLIANGGHLHDGGGPKYYYDPNSANMMFAPEVIVSNKGDVQYAAPLGDNQYGVTAGLLGEFGIPIETTRQENNIQYTQEDVDNLIKALGYNPDITRPMADLQKMSEPGLQQVYPEFALLTGGRGLSTGWGTGIANEARNIYASMLENPQLWTKAAQQTTLGLAGMEGVNEGVRQFTPYESWGDMVNKGTYGVVPTWLGEFSNPGGFAGAFDANLNRGLQALERSLTGIGKQGVKWTANMADRAARNIYAPYDYLRTIEETPIDRNKLLLSIKGDFENTKLPKGIEIFDGPYRETLDFETTRKTGKSTFIKEPATPPEKHGFDVYGLYADAPVVFDSQGRPMDRTLYYKDGRFTDPVDNSIIVGKETNLGTMPTSIFHHDIGNYPISFDETGKPFIRRIVSDTDSGELGPIWWEKNKSFSGPYTLDQRLIKTPLDESYGVPNRTGFGNDTTVLTADYPVGDAEFLQKDGLIGTLSRGRFASKPLATEEPPTLSWEEATAPKITEENAAELTNNGQFINIDQLENSDVYKGYLEGFKYFNRFSEPQTAYYRSSPVTVVGELSTTPLEESFVIPYYLRTLEERMPQIKNRYVYQETEDGNFVPRKGLDVIKEEMKKPTSVYLTNADTQNINGFHSSYGSFVGIDQNSLLRDIMSTKIHETIGHGTEDTVEALVGQKVVQEYADLAEDLINSGIKLTSDRSKLWTELRNLILQTRTNLMQKARYKTHNAFQGDVLTDHDIDAFRKSIDDINDISEITDVLDYYIPSAYAVDYSNLLKLKPELLPKFKFLLQKGLSVGMPIGAAGALYGVSQQSNNNVQAYGGPIVNRANMFDDGGSKKKLSDMEYYSIMERVAEMNNPIWNAQRMKEGERPLSADEEYLRILNDNTYDYRGFYNDNPVEAADASTHWPDKYKTVYHPTFSTYSDYSGKVSDFNPLGLKGGRWPKGPIEAREEDFIPAWWQSIPNVYTGRQHSEGGPLMQQANVFGGGGSLIDNLFTATNKIKERTQRAVDATRKQYLNSGYTYKNGKLTKKGRQALRSQYSVAGRIANKLENIVDAAEKNLMLQNPIKFYDKKSEWFPGYRQVELPWYKDQVITLQDAGSLTGAKISANIFDSLYKAVNYNPQDMDIVENIGAKETTFGNPTDDNSFFKLKTSDKPTIALLKAINKANGNKWGNVQHINHGQSLTGSKLLNFGAWPNPWEDAWVTASDYDREEDVEKIKQRLIDSYNYTQRMDDYWRNSGEFDKNVIQAAVELYKKGRYNPGQGNYREYSTKKGDELRNSSTYKEYIKPKRRKHKIKVKKEDVWQ